MTPDTPDFVTVLATIHTPATTLHNVPVTHDAFTGLLISAEIEGCTVTRAALARLLHPEMLLRIVRLPKERLAAVIKEAAE
jgi:hypothetical protein